MTPESFRLLYEWIDLKPSAQRVDRRFEAIKEVAKGMNPEQTLDLVRLVVRGDSQPAARRICEMIDAADPNSAADVGPAELRLLAHGAVAHLLQRQTRGNTLCACAMYAVSALGQRTQGPHELLFGLSEKRFRQLGADLRTTSTTFDASIEAIGTQIDEVAAEKVKANRQTLATRTKRKLGELKKLQESEKERATLEAWLSQWDGQESALEDAIAAAQSVLHLCVKLPPDVDQVERVLQDALTRHGNSKIDLRRSAAIESDLNEMTVASIAWLCPLHSELGGVDAGPSDTPSLEFSAKELALQVTIETSLLKLLGNEVKT